MDTGWSKAYLNGVLLRWKWVDIYTIRLSQLRDQIITYGSGGLGERVQTSPTGDALEKRVLKFIEDTDRIQIALYDKLEEANAMQDEASERIMQLKPGRCQTLLIDHYIRRIEFGELSDLYGYEDGNTIYKVHQRALEYFEEIANSAGWKKSKLSI
jgi:hypothetical protein